MTDQQPERREVEVDPSVIGASAEGIVGLTCGKCGCPDMRIRCTEDISGGVRRYRYCRNCGHGLPTTEIAASELANLRRLAGLN